jgi:hypothetical protein
MKCDIDSAGNLNIECASHAEYVGMRAWIDEWTMKNLALLALPYLTHRRM